MESLPSWIKEARARWKYRGDERPSFAAPVHEGQESVWDYPRPPRIERDVRHVVIRFHDFTLADSRGTLRVLETASPPTFYVPREDIRMDALHSVPSVSFCEWKGEATYWTISHEGQTARNAGWSYEKPLSGFEPIAGHIGFYATTLHCFVDGVRVLPQPGGLYGGWVTPEIAGPFKGAFGTELW